MFRYAALYVRDGLATDAELGSELGLGQVGSLASLSDQVADFAALADSMGGVGCCHNCHLYHSNCGNDNEICLVLSDISYRSIDAGGAQLHSRWARPIACPCEPLSPRDQWS